MSLGVIGVLLTRSSEQATLTSEIVHGFNPRYGLNVKESKRSGESCVFSLSHRVLQFLAHTGKVDRDGLG